MTIWAYFVPVCAITELRCAKYALYKHIALYYTVIYVTLCHMRDIVYACHAYDIMSYALHCVRYYAV